MSAIMKAYENDEEYAKLTLEDRERIFTTVLLGSSDITSELILKLCSEYNLGEDEFNKLVKGLTESSIEEDSASISCHKMSSMPENKFEKINKVSAELMELLYKGVDTVSGADRLTKATDMSLMLVDLSSSGLTPSEFLKAVPSFNAVFYAFHKIGLERADSDALSLYPSTRALLVKAREKAELLNSLANEKLCEFRGYLSKPDAQNLLSRTLLGLCVELDHFQSAIYKAGASVDKVMELRRMAEASYPDSVLDPSLISAFANKAREVLDFQMKPGKEDNETFLRDYYRINASELIGKADYALRLLICYKYPHILLWEDDKIQGVDYTTL